MAVNDNNNQHWEGDECLHDGLKGESTMNCRRSSVGVGNSKKDTGWCLYFSFALGIFYIVNLIYFHFILVLFCVKIIS